MTHQATANRFSLCSCTLSVVTGSLFTGLDVSVVAPFVFRTDGRTDTMCETNDHLLTGAWWINNKCCEFYEPPSPMKRFCVFLFQCISIVFVIRTNYVHANVDTQCVNMLTTYRLGPGGSKHEILTYLNHNLNLLTTDPVAHPV